MPKSLKELKNKRELKNKILKIRFIAKSGHKWNITHMQTKNYS